MHAEDSSLDNADEEQSNFFTKLKNLDKGKRNS